MNKKLFIMLVLMAGVAGLFFAGSQLNKPKATPEQKPSVVSEKGLMPSVSSNVAPVPIVVPPSSVPVAASPVIIPPPSTVAQPVQAAIRNPGNSMTGAPPFVTMPSPPKGKVLSERVTPPNVEGIIL